MRHLSQQMIAEEVRRPHLRKYRRHLHETLRDPGLGAEARKRVLAALENAGRPKTYDSIEPPPSGALDPGPMPQPAIEIDLQAATHDSLSATPHTRLYLYAVQRGLKVSPGDTKVQTISAILDTIQGGDR